MANMTQGDRNQFERATIGSETLNRPRDGSNRGTTITFVVLLAILAALSWAAIEAIDGWAHWVVIADLVLVTVALAVFMRSRTKTDDPASAAEDSGWRPKGF